MPEPRIGSLCTGYGGLDIAVQKVFGGTTAWTADIDPGAARIITHHMPGIPNLGDLTTTDWQAVLDEHGPVDIVTGGYPCQPFSSAGLRKGTADERHIWPYIADALRVLRPRIAVFENVANHLRLGFDTVLADLARLGFDAQWCVASASEVGAPHQRKRLFIYATAQDPDGTARDQRRLAAPRQEESRGTRPDTRGRGGAPAADTGREGLEVRGVEPDRHERQAAERGRGEAATDITSVGRGEGRPEPARFEGRLGTALGGGTTPADTDRDGCEEQQRREPGMGSWGDADGRGPERWGRFAPAIARWEAVTGRRAPWATDARNRLNPVFVEWLMGLDAGHVTEVPGLTRTQQLKALGNGVVPQQAEAAIRLLHERATADTAPQTATAA
ncbi:DNA cytosine methyltransferase [Streptomyces sp. CS081A]|uniref:DNA cytosine methyltransferase n=1 Tax=Streptomyces sp. CS081A TaxID=2162709 RepID=UPI000D51257B|nr:DNA cytosine methyltransferase [Streptomyces sp. CS081A]PVC73506.1 DNA cytosine methyltransferase [Streptomyces sp. CS081A]